MRTRNRSRGSLMLGLSSWIVILAAFCTAVLLRSTEAYRQAGLLEQKLEMRAAAEGAVVLARNGMQPGQRVSIGRCIVSTEPLSAGSTQTQVIRVAMMTSTGKEVRTQRFSLPADAVTSGTGQIGVVALP